MSGNEQQALTDFTSYVIANNERYHEADRIYLANQLQALIGSTGFPLGERQSVAHSAVLDIVWTLVEAAVTHQKIADVQAARDSLEAQLMDYVTPYPAKVQADFWENYATSPATATDAFYQLGKTTHYIQTDKMAKNTVYPVSTAYGDLVITINLSKPEKDPKQIAAERNAPAVGYPKCQLCIENEGYAGRIDYPARSNHRIIPFTVLQEAWGFQYSPYAYYNEHCIFLAQEHRPMKIGRSTFERLLAIIDTFPHYFAGSNADLPIVGGSILSHDHYQGGQSDFAMAQAPIERYFELPAYPNVTLGVVKWPMSVIRLQSSDRTALVDVATAIFDQWGGYSDESVDILAYSAEGERHHTVTPIARKKDGKFELDLVLRDNHTSETYPEGVFHPHPEVHPIKKENIGLIEVMGLAILPPRLKKELAEVEAYLLGESADLPAHHQAWVAERIDRQAVTAETVEQLVQQAVGELFLQALLDAGVYKRDPQGQAAFDRFLATLVEAY